jgi:hypothetical protein
VVIISKDRNVGFGRKEGRWEGSDKNSKIIQVFSWGLLILAGVYMAQKAATLELALSQAQRQAHQFCDGRPTVVDYGATASTDELNNLEHNTVKLTRAEWWQTLLQKLGPGKVHIQMHTFSTCNCVAWKMKNNNIVCWIATS